MSTQFAFPEYLAPANIRQRAKAPLVQPMFVYGGGRAEYVTLADGLARNNTLHNRRKRRCARAPPDVAREWKNLTYSVAAGALTPPSYTDTAPASLVRASDPRRQKRCQHLKDGSKTPNFASDTSPNDEKGRIVARSTCDEHIRSSRLRRFLTRLLTPKNRILTQNARRSARESLVESLDGCGGGRGRGQRGALPSAATTRELYQELRLALPLRPTRPLVMIYARRMPRIQISLSLEPVPGRAGLPALSVALVQAPQALKQHIAVRRAKVSFARHALPLRRSPAARPRPPP
ncbi:uncharacterized protein SCHCODRAFT_02558385 [Schizophyllum commune H4-8]|uniref:uncharacterized protein n=1 Tax=Schizophyllum commune (strain H4-8 / FGSC 9210) TaxID=578458 RepID=UPI0021608964|nr:uncharacterized protein SCHCODRAFT_02558385 [Schizophyllum commune H4-8]KAI5885192.1 hypothetical protein SCHCODRAFT_02558385 [Schizophyllum commune H4-8]